MEGQGHRRRVRRFDWLFVRADEVAIHPGSLFLRTRWPSTFFVCFSPMPTQRRQKCSALGNHPCDNIPTLRPWAEISKRMVLAHRDPLLRSPPINRPERVRSCGIRLPVITPGFAGLPRDPGWGPTTPRQ